MTYIHYNTYIDRDINTYTRTYVRTYVLHTYIHTYVRTYMHTNKDSVNMQLPGLWRGELQAALWYPLQTDLAVVEHSSEMHKTSQTYNLWNAVLVLNVAMLTKQLMKSNQTKPSKVFP